MSLAVGARMGAASPPPLKGSGATQISIFSAFLGLWGAAEVGAPRGLGSCWAAFLCPPNHREGGTDQRREALVGWNSPSLPVDKLSLIQAWGVVWLLQRERERERTQEIGRVSGRREAGTYKHSDTDTHTISQRVSPMQACT